MKSIDLAWKQSVLAALVVGLCGVANVANAQQPGSRPRLGIQGHFDYGYGMVVDRVRWGTPAGSIGLEPGDVVRAINGRWLRTEADYARQLRDADGSVVLVVEDVRTGRLLSRTVPVGVRRGEYAVRTAAWDRDPQIGRGER